MRKATVTMLLIFMASSGAAPQTNKKEPVTSLKSRIPPPKKSVYGAIREGAAWQNPYLIAMEDGVAVMRNGDAAPIVSVEQLMKLLEDLPRSAWPYGLVVAVQRQSVCCRHSDGEARIQANQAELVSRLKRAGIVVSLWPSG